MRELRWCYYQRPLDGGRIEVRTAAGRDLAVWPHEICDALPGRAVPVQAQTRASFIAQHACREGQAPPVVRANAHVLYASRRRSGKADLYVWFDDPANNTSGRPIMAIMEPALWREVLPLVRRDIMPVQQYSGRAAPYSVDRGVRAAQRRAARAVATFLLARCAPSGSP